MASLLATLKCDLGVDLCSPLYLFEQFGVCFGAQLIATAIGGKSAPMRRRYSGWYENDVPKESAWYGPWLRWHGDELDVPAGAEIIATSESTIQAFQYRRALRVQFHPEAGEETLQNWTGLASEEQRKRLDVAGLLTESLERFAQMSEERDRLFGAMLARVAL
jgi:GMP synthase-like glutamine amidotransferase